MSKEQLCISNLLEVMQQAINSGDWEVDGACDPSLAMNQASYLLMNAGWRVNSIDGHWMPPEQS